MNETQSVTINPIGYKNCNSAPTSNFYNFIFHPFFSHVDKAEYEVKRHWSVTIHLRVPKNYDSKHLHQKFLLNFTRHPLPTPSPKCSKDVFIRQCSPPYSISK